MKATVAILIGSALFLAACGGRQAGPPGGTPVSREAVVVKMSEFKYEPATVETKAGTVEFKLQNLGTVEHSFIIVNTGKGTEQVRPGAEATLAVDLKPGTYTVECDVAGHKEAGMVMTLVVK